MVDERIVKKEFVERRNVWYNRMITESSGEIHTSESSADNA